MMQYAEIVGAQKPLKISSKPIPEAPEDGMLLKTVNSGICHTDVHLIHDENDMGQGKIFRRRDVIGEEKFKGIVPGHEICGTILSFGANAKPEEHGLKVGDLVAIHPFCGCGDCGLCNNGQCNECLNNVAGRYDMGLGPNKPGGYATHVPIAKLDYAVKIPKEISPDIASILSCSALTAYEAILRAKDGFEHAHKSYGKVSCLVIGAGGLGLWGVQLTKLAYPDMNITVSCLDISEEKVELAKGAGADEGILLKRDATNEEQLSQVTLGKTRQFDVILDFVGVPKTFEVCVSAVKKCGTYMLVGLFGGGVHFSLLPIVWQSLTIRGTRAGTPATLRDLVKKAANWKLHYPAPEFYTLDKVNEALESLAKGKVKGRAVLKFE